MPIYEYLCTECGIRFDRLQAIGSNNAECHECGMPSKKAISIFAAVTSYDGNEPSAVAGMGGCPGCAGGGCACSSVH